MHRIIEFESRISPQTLCHPVLHTHPLIHSFTQRTFMVHSNLSVLHAVGKRNYMKRWKARHTVRLTDLVWRQASVPPHVPISLLSIIPLHLPGPVILTPTEFLQSVRNGFTTQIPLQLSCDCSTSMKGSPWNTLEQTRVSLEQQPDIKCGKNRDDRFSKFPRYATGCMGLPERQHCVAVFWLILREPCPLCMLSYGLWWWC